jgi:hypothetical protein
VDLETGQQVPIADGALVLPVKGRDFRLIALPFHEAPRITAGDLLATALDRLPDPGFEDQMIGLAGEHSCHSGTSAEP